MCFLNSDTHLLFCFCETEMRAFIFEAVNSHALLAVFRDSRTFYRGIIVLVGNTFRFYRVGVPIHDLIVILVVHLTPRGVDKTVSFYKDKRPRLRPLAVAVWFTLFLSRHSFEKPARRLYFHHNFPPFSSSCLHIS